MKNRRTRKTHLKFDIHITTLRNKFKPSAKNKQVNEDSMKNKKSWKETNHRKADLPPDGLKMEGQSYTQDGYKLYAVRYAPEKQKNNNNNNDDNDNDNEDE